MARDAQCATLLIAAMVISVWFTFLGALEHEAAPRILFWRFVLAVLATVAGVGALWVIFTGTP